MTIHCWSPNLNTGNSDRVICFRCDVNLKDWERSDNPLNEHDKWTSNCEYLKMVGVSGQSSLNRSGFFGLNQKSGVTPNMFVRQIDPKTYLNKDKDVCS